MSRPIILFSLFVCGLLTTCGAPPADRQTRAADLADSSFGEEAYQLLCRHVAGREYPDDRTGQRGQNLCRHTDLARLSAASSSRRLAHLVASRQDLTSTFEHLGQAATPEKLNAWLQKILALEDAGHLSRWVDAAAELLGALGQVPEFVDLLLSNRAAPGMGETSPGLASRMFRLRALSSLVDSWTTPQPPEPSGLTEDLEYTSIVTHFLRLNAEASSATRKILERIKTQVHTYLFTSPFFEPEGTGDRLEQNRQRPRIFEILDLLRAAAIESPDGIAAVVLRLIQEARPTPADIAYRMASLDKVSRAPELEQHLREVARLFIVHRDDFLLLLERFSRAIEISHATFPDLKDLYRAFTEMTDVLLEIGREPGLAASLSAVFIEEDAVTLSAHIARQMAYRDLIDYDLEAINGPSVGRLTTPVDRSSTPKGENRSVWQRLLNLVRATSELEICNERLSAPLPPYAACTLFRVPDAARFYLQAMGGRAELTLHLNPEDDFFPEQLAATQELSPGKSEMEAFTGIDGFRAAPLVYPIVPPALTFSVRPEAASRLMFALWDPRIDPESDFGLGRPAAQLVSARTMTSEGPLDEVHRATLFAWEDPSFLRVVSPFLQPFLDCGRDDLLVRLLVVLDAYWSPSDSSEIRSFSSFEPMLTALLSDANAVHAAQDIARSVRDMGGASFRHEADVALQAQKRLRARDDRDLEQENPNRFAGDNVKLQKVSSGEDLVRFALGTAAQVFRSNIFKEAVAHQARGPDAPSCLQAQAFEMTLPELLQALSRVFSQQNDDPEGGWPVIVSSFLRLATASPDRFFALNGALFELVTEDRGWMVSFIEQALASVCDAPQSCTQNVARRLLDQQMTSLKTLGRALKTLAQSDTEKVFVALLAALGRPLPNQDYTGLDVLTRVATNVMQEQADSTQNLPPAHEDQISPDNFLLRAQAYVLDVDSGLRRLLAIVQNKRVALD